MRSCRSGCALLLPAVENAISANAYRPGDVLGTRKGLTVEIGNTDAEGRVILCDALALADEEKPDLLIDLATLTGAARVALGSGAARAVHCLTIQLARELVDIAAQQGDPVWRMPLWSAYEDELSSKIADVNNVSSSSFSGAIFGALFLQRFVTEARSLGAPRSVCMERQRAAGTTGRRGTADSPRALRVPEAPLLALTATHVCDHSRVRASLRRWPAATSRC